MSRDPSPVASTRRIWLISGAIAAVAGLAAGVLGGWAMNSTTQAPSTRPASGACNAVTVANEALPTVVTINAGGADGAGVGSGAIIRAQGYIITNDHVIAPGADSGSISVTFADGKRQDAELVGRDPRSDIAVVKVKAGADPFPVISFGDSAEVVVGQPVIALGAPLGLSSSVSAGIVSALGRDLPVPSGDDRTVLVGAIQTDAAINPGNSGGALVDCLGRLVGVNTAISTVPNSEGVSGGGSVGIGFAVPVNWALEVADDLIDAGKVSYAYFGARVTPISAAVAERWDVEGGLFVEAIDPRGSVAQAGIRAGDVILAIDGRKATRNDVLTRLTFGKRAGDSVSVDYLRNGERRNASVVLVAAP